MKILMNFSDYAHTPQRKKQNTYGGVGYYRIVKPSEQIKTHEVKVIGKEIIEFGDTLEEQWDNVFKQYDIYWTSYFSDPVVGSAIVYCAKKHGKKFIVDVDDNYLDVPETNLLYERFKKTKKDRAYLSTILSFADAITVSTEPLKERLQEHIKVTHGIDKPIYVIPNMNDVRDWAYAPVKKSKDVIIGYSGSNSHQDDLQMVLPAIKTVMEKYPNVRFQLLGTVEKDLIPTYFKGFSDDCLDRIELVGATPTFREYPEWLSKQKWDMGIAPLVDTAFTRCKSHIKWMEYSMYKIPTIASRVYPYFMDIDGKKTIINNETGLLVRNHEWVPALCKLIEGKEERQRLGENAYNYVKENWQYKDSRIDDILSEMIKKVQSS
jgi:glycosyltransferase involved in cell wall biosynthesis